MDTLDQLDIVFEMESLLSLLLQVLYLDDGLLAITIQFQ